MRIVRLILLTSALLFAWAGPSIAQDSDSPFIVEVVDSAGTPIKSACVTFVPRSGDILFRKADKHGKVRIKRMHRGNYRVVVKVDGYEAQKREVVVDGAKDTVSFVMHPRDSR